MPLLRHHANNPACFGAFDSSAKARVHSSRGLDGRCNPNLYGSAYSVVCSGIAGSRYLQHGDVQL